MFGQYESESVTLSPGSSAVFPLGSSMSLGHRHSSLWLFRVSNTLTAVSTTHPMSRDIKNVVVVIILPSTLLTSTVVY